MADGYTSQGKIMPEWWINQIIRAKQFRRQYAKEDEWATWRKWYRGEWNPGILPSNVYFKMMRTLIPRVYYRNPSVSLTPSKPGIEHMLLAKLVERADNKLIEVMGVKGQMKRMVQHACMFGTGFGRLGYGAEFTPTPDDIDTTQPDVGGRRRRKRVEYNDLIHPNAPWFLAAHPGQMTVPHGCTDIHSARWTCYETTRPVDDIEADPRFKNNKDLGAGQSDTRLLARSQSMSERSREGVVLWEIRDKKTGAVFVIAPHATETSTPGAKVLFEDDDDFQVGGRLPVYPLVFNNDDEVFWGISDSQILAPQQGEKNELRTQIRNHRRTALIKLLAETGAISPDEESKLTDGNSRSVVHVKTLTGIKELTPAPIPQALIEGEAIIDREIELLLGMGTNQFGEYAPGSADRSATEAQIVNQATQIRIDERRDSCADLLVDFVTDMNQIIMERWDREMVLDVVGPVGAPIWIRMKPTELKGMVYNIKVDPDTSLPQTKALREQKALTIYGILKSNPLINPIELTTFLLTEMYGVYADSLMQNPLFQSTPDNPLTLADAVKALRELPPANRADIATKFAQQAQLIPPGTIQS